METVKCIDSACEREFMGRGVMRAHAESVHSTLALEMARRDQAADEPTFDDIEEMVREAVREKYYKPGDYHASPPVDTIWAWVRDLSQTWVVFVVEEGGDDTLYQASYSILDRVVTLGEPVEVVRKTIYEPVKKES